MFDYETKTDNVSVLPAASFNNLALELENAVTKSGITLDTLGSSTSVEMLAQAITRASQGGYSYQDSGTADAYVLTAIGSFKQPSAYFDGQVVLFKAGNNNTGVSTINVASIGVTDLKDKDGVALASGAIVADSYYFAQYDLTATEFRIILSAGGVSGGIFSEEFESAEQAITLGGNLTIAHGLTATPKMVSYFLICKTANLNYSVNDLVPIDFNQSTASASSPNNSVVDATNINLKYSSAQAPSLPDRTSGNPAVITAGSWRLIVKAYA